MAARRGNKGALWGVERSLIVGEMRARAENSGEARGHFPTNSSLKGSVSVAPALLPPLSRRVPVLVGGPRPRLPAGRRV